MNTTPAPKITLDRESCPRCGGTGTYPSPLYGGVCLGCDGVGRSLTAAGAAAATAINDWRDAHLTLAADALTPGDRVKIPGHGSRTVQDVEVTEDGLVRVTFTNRVARVTPADALYTKAWTRAAVLRMAEDLAGTPGLTVTGAEVSA